MKIVVVCESNTESSLGQIYSKAFKKFGHEICEFYDIVDMEKESILFKFPVVKRINNWRLQGKNYWGILQKGIVSIFKRFMVNAEKASNDKLIKLCNEFNPDILVVFKGKTIQKGTLLRIKEKIDCILIHFNGDNHNNPYSTSKNMLDSLALYDVVFTWSHALFEPLYKLGAKRVESLPFAFDETIHGLEDEDVSSDNIPDFAHDVVFVGTWDREREKTLSILADLDLGIWGPRWKRVSWKSPLYRCIKGGEVDAKTMGKIYRASKVCLNIMRPQNQESHNMKSFEIPALGGFMLTNRTADHLSIFEEGKEIACFDNVDELRSQILRYVKEDSIRKEMAKNAQKKVRACGHSYTDRAARMIDIATNKGEK